MSLLIRACLISAAFLLLNTANLDASDLVSYCWPEGLPAATKADERKGVPNDKAPASTQNPSHKLNSLDKDWFGTVRRVNIRNGRKVAALTFDVCELQCTVSGFDYDLVKFLIDNKIHATFFAGGKWMRSHKERVLQLMAIPEFEIGNHTWSHANFAIIDLEMAKSQIQWTQAYYESLYEELQHRAENLNCRELMQKVFPYMKYFRLPYGRCRTETLQLLQEMGLKVIQWDVVADEHGIDNASESAARNVAARVRPGSILLIHANKVPRNSAALTKNLVRILHEKGYEFLTISELLALGQAEITSDGYFTKPGDNVSLDKSFGKYGTGE